MSEGFMSQAAVWFTQERTKAHLAGLETKGRGTSLCYSAELKTFAPYTERRRCRSGGERVCAGSADTVRRQYTHETDAEYGDEG